MYKATLILDTDVLDATIELTKQAPKRVFLFVEGTLKPRLADLLLTALHTEPGRPKYPLRWASDKQRRFVMRKLRKENNLPYRRTGRLVAAWRVDTTYHANEGLMQVVNPSRVGRYVFGDQQQPFHEDTGWYEADDVVLKFSEQAQDELINFWYKETGAK